MINPKYLYIETTNRCNASCIMCPHPKMTRPKGTMSWEFFCLIIDQCKQLDLCNLKLFLHKEGEPLLDSLLFKRIHHARNELKKIKELSINTNGHLMSSNIAEKIVNSELDKIYISIDGNSKYTYNKIRKFLDFDVVTSNVENLIKLKKISGSKIKIIIQMLVNDINKHEVFEFKSRWADQADEIYIKATHSYLDGNLSIFKNNNTFEQKHACFDPFNVIVVFWNGDCGVCCWDYDNLLKTDNTSKSTILEIFNGKEFDKIRAAHLGKRCIDTIPCNRCLRIFGDDKICDYEKLSNSMT